MIRNNRVVSCLVYGLFLLFKSNVLAAYDAKSLYDRYANSIVCIKTAVNCGQGTQIFTGTGFLVSSGEVVTARHVLKPKCPNGSEAPNTQTTVFLPPNFEKRQISEITKQSEEDDLAVFRIENVNNRTYLPLGDPRADEGLKQGQSLLAFGYPHAGGNLTQPEVPRPGVAQFPIYREIDIEKKCIISGQLDISKRRSFVVFGGPEQSVGLEGGYSGGPIFHAESGKVVGISQGYYKLCGQNQNSMPFSLAVPSGKLNGMLSPSVTISSLLESVTHELNDLQRKELRAIITSATVGFFNTYQCVIIHAGRDILNNICSKRANQPSPCRPDEVLNIYTTDIKKQTVLLEKTCNEITRTAEAYGIEINLECSTILKKNSSIKDPWYNIYHSESWLSLSLKGINTKFQFALFQSILHDRLGKSDKVTTDQEKKARQARAAEKVAEVWAKYMSDQSLLEAEQAWNRLQSKCQDCRLGLEKVLTTSVSWPSLLSYIFEKIIINYTNKDLDFFPGCSNWVLVWDQNRWNKQTKCENYTGMNCLSAPRVVDDEVVKSAAENFAKQLVP